MRGWNRTIFLDDLKAPLSAVLLQLRAKVLLILGVALFLEDRLTLDGETVSNLLLHDLREHLIRTRPVGVLNVLYKLCE